MTFEVLEDEPEVEVEEVVDAGDGEVLGNGDCEASVCSSTALGVFGLESERPLGGSLRAFELALGESSVG